MYRSEGTMHPFFQVCTSRVAHMFEPGHLDRLASKDTAARARLSVFRPLLNQAYRKHAFAFRIHSDETVVDATTNEPVGDASDRLIDTPFGDDFLHLMAFFHTSLRSKLTDREKSMLSVLVEYASVVANPHRTMLYVSPVKNDNYPLPNKALIRHAKRLYDPVLADYFEKCPTDAQFHLNTAPKKRQRGAHYSPPKPIPTVTRQTGRLVHYGSLSDVGRVRKGDVLYSSTNYMWVHTSPNWVFETDAPTVRFVLHVHPSDRWGCVVTRRDAYPDNANVFEELEYHQSYVVVSDSHHLALRVTSVRAGDAHAHAEVDCRLV